MPRAAPPRARLRRSMGPSFALLVGRISNPSCGCEGSILLLCGPLFPQGGKEVAPGPRGGDKPPSRRDCTAAVKSEVMKVSGVADARGPVLEDPDLVASIGLVGAGRTPPWREPTESSYP